MNKDKLTGVEKSIHAAVETFQKNLCREMAKRLDEGILTAPRCDLEAAYGATQEEIARQQQLKNKYKRVVQELAATLLPDAPPEEAAALVARMAEENLAGPTAKRDPRTVELVQLDEEPWAIAVGEVNVFRMNQNSGGIDDEYDY